MLTVNIDFDDANKEFGYVPSGTYEAIIKKANARTYRTGACGIYLVLELEEKEHPDLAGITLNDNLFFTKNAFYKPKSVAEALGITIGRGNIELEEVAEQLFLSRIRISVLNGKNEDGSITSRVAKYLPSQKKGEGTIKSRVMDAIKKNKFHASSSHADSRPLDDKFENYFEDSWVEQEVQFINEQSIISRLSTEQSQEQFNDEFEDYFEDSWAEQEAQFIGEQIILSRLITEQSLER